MKKKLFALLVAMIMVVSCLAGCSGGSEGSDSSEAGVSKDLNIGANEIVPLDPHTGSAAIFTECIGQCYEGLIDLSLDGEIVPRLAESWEYNDDGTEYTFHLRKDVTFHDGSAMTAKDVKYSIERLLAMGQGFSYLVSSYIDSVEIIDDATVKVKLSKTFGPFLQTMLRVYIVSEDMVTANYDTSSDTYGDKGDYGEGWLGYHDAGTGPYVLNEISPQEKATFSKYADYWKGWNGDEPENVNFQLVTEAATVKSMMTAGQLDVTDMYQSQESLTSLGAIDGIDITSVDQGSILYLQMNTKCEPLDDVHVRKAIAHLVDSATLIESLGSAMPATSLVSSSVAGHTDDVTQYEYSIDKAKEELAQSKYADQLDSLSVELYWIDVVPDEQKVGLAIQSAAKEAGLNIELVQSAWLNFTDMVAKEETTPALSLSFNAPDYPEAGAILVSRFHSSTCGTWSQTEWLQDETVDSLLDKAMVTMEADERMGIYEEVQKYLSDIVPSVPVYRSINLLAYASGRVEWTYSDYAQENGAAIAIPGDAFRAYDYFKIK